MNPKSLLLESAQALGIALSETQTDQFMQYLSLLLEWNEKMNLTAITDPVEVVQKHFIDCISVLPHLDLQGGETMIDVGTGAGFPGVPLKIANPALQVTLLDALQKRLTFLDTLTQSLDLSDVTLVHSRAEDGGQNPDLREQFDLCVSRAVANLAVLLEYCLPFVKVGGKLAALKGPDATQEIEQAQNALQIVGGKVTAVIPITIPHTDLQHQLVLVEKIAPTPQRYPRKAGKISKKPL